jgi:hypothetical protein
LRSIVDEIQDKRYRPQIQHSRAASDSFSKAFICLTKNQGMQEENSILNVSKGQKSFQI